MIWFMMTIMMIIIVAEQILQSTEQRDKNPAERKSGRRGEEERRGELRDEWRKSEEEWIVNRLACWRKAAEGALLVIWLPLVVEQPHWGCSQTAAAQPRALLTQFSKP